MNLMKKIFFVSGLLLLPLLASAGDISQIVFTNDPRTVKPNEVAQLTIQLQYEGDSHPTSCMEMLTNSGSGQFSSSDTNWNSVNKLTINSNWTNKNFYYKDSTEGNYVLTVKVTPVSCSALTDEEAQWTASQNISVSSDGTSAPIADASLDPAPLSSDSGWPEYVPPEDRPQITAYAGKDMVLVAGALGQFRGEGYDFNNEPMEKARYLWNFGDGGMKEGQNVSYFYRYPGEYIVTLDISSGKNSASDRLLVKVVPNKIIISEVKTGAESFVEIYNGSKDEINISGWQVRSSSPLQSGYKTFSLPQNTFVRPFGYSVFPVFVSGMILPQGGGKVELLYQTGLLADFFEYNGFLGNSQSFSCSTLNVEQVYIAGETPGEKNTEPELSYKSSGSSNSPNKVQNSNIPTPSTVQSNGEDEAEKATTSAETYAPESQQANVISAVGDSGQTSKTKFYLWGVVGLVIFSALGVVFVRRDSSA